MRNIQKSVREILKKVAKEHNVDYELVEDIFFTQFEFVVFNMEKGNKFKSYEEFENIYLRHLGSFIASKGCVKKMISIDEKCNSNEGRTLDNKVESGG